MATITRGQPDNGLVPIKSALDEYERVHPGAEAFLYRQNSVSVRIKIIDQRFAGVSKGDRHDRVWGFLAQRIAEDSVQDISVLLLLAPAEQTTSFMNQEFNDPIPSRL